MRYFFESFTLTLNHYSFKVIAILAICAFALAEEEEIKEAQPAPAPVPVSNPQMKYFYKSSPFAYNYHASMYPNYYHAFPYHAQMMNYAAPMTYAAPMSYTAPMSYASPYAPMNWPAPYPYYPSYNQFTPVAYDFKGFGKKSMMIALKKKFLNKTSHFNKLICQLQNILQPQLKKRKRRHPLSPTTSTPPTFTHSKKIKR